MADTLTQLAHVLRSRDGIRENIRKLELEAAAGKEGKVESDLEKQSRRLASADRAIAAARKAVSSEIEESHAEEKSAEAELSDLEAKHLAGEISNDLYGRETTLLQRRASIAAGRASVRERALQAETAKDLDWLATAPDEHLMTEADTQRAAQAVRYADFSGATVPERIMMLRREFRRPQSRHPIRVSAIAMGVLALIVIGVVLIAGRSAPRDASDYLGRGDYLVPVLVENAEYVRTLEFTLQYDPEELRGVSVIQGDVGRLAYMQYDIDKDGFIEVQVRDVLGIEGSGSIIIVRFTASDILPDPLPIAFASLDAQDVRTMEELPVEGDAGWINTETVEVLAPVIRFP